MNKLKKFLTRKTTIKEIYWLPKRLTLKKNPPIYRWLWFNFKKEE